jgi:hypothetical protein
MHKKTTEQYIKQVMLLHGNVYDYSLVHYNAAHSKIQIICHTHGVFYIRAGDHLHSKQGCYSCANIAKTKTTEQYVANATLKHNGKYDYSLVKYTKNYNQIDIICKVHGKFTQKANDHLNGTNCPRCATNSTHTVEQFIQQARKIHGNRYDYSLVQYIASTKKVIIICNQHGKFEQTPGAHILQQGCPNCVSPNYSSSSIRWLNCVAQEHNIYIEHADNLGEFRIPGTKLKADGYCVETNTIYEFHGDYWHGNPDVYGPDYINKIKQTPMSELYAATKSKEQIIKNLGHNLVVMWESEWDNINKNNKKKEDNGN